MIIRGKLMYFNPFANINPVMLCLVLLIENTQRSTWSHDMQNTKTKKTTPLNLWKRLIYIYRRQTAYQ